MKSYRIDNEPLDAFMAAESGLPRSAIDDITKVSVELVTAILDGAGGLDLIGDIPMQAKVMAERTGLDEALVAKALDARDRFNRSGGRCVRRGH